jgi:hypothetical protein
VASLAETASFDGTEEACEELAWLLASQSKEKSPPISTRVKSIFFGMAIPPFSYRRILNKGKAHTRRKRINSFINKRVY